MLERLVPDVQEREAFVCGPPPMMKRVIGALRALRVSGSRIHYATSCADPQRHSTASGKRRINDGMHFLQQHVDSIVLAFGDGDLDCIAQGEDLLPLVGLVRGDVLVPLPCPLGNVGEECLHGVTRCPDAKMRALMRRIDLPAPSFIPCP